MLGKELSAFICKNEDLPKIEKFVGRVSVSDIEGDDSNGVVNFVQRLGRGFSLCVRTSSGYLAIDLGKDFEEYETPTHNHESINNGGIVTALAWFD